MIQVGHGTSFDRLVRAAREQIDGLALDPESALNGRRKATRAKSGREGRHAAQGGEPPIPIATGIGAHGEGGNRTRDTTIFSRVLYQLSYLAWGRLSAGEG
jgi:hypothetical protein